MKRLFPGWLLVVPVLIGAPLASAPSAAQSRVDKPANAPIRVLGLAFTSDDVRGGESVQLKIALTRPAPSGGLTITFSGSGLKALFLPKTITVPAGVARIGLTVTPRAVKSRVHVTLTGSIGNEAPKAAAASAHAATLTINP